MASNYPPGAEHDPRAPWNDPGPLCEIQIGKAVGREAERYGGGVIYEDDDCGAEAESECEQCGKCICYVHMKTKERPHSFALKPVDRLAYDICTDCYEQLNECAGCGEKIWLDKYDMILASSDEYAETERGLVHVSCMKEGEEIA